MDDKISDICKDGVQLKDPINIRLVLNFNKNKSVLFKDAWALCNVSGNY